MGEYYEKKVLESWTTTFCWVVLGCSCDWFGGSALFQKKSNYPNYPNSLVDQNESK